MNFTLKAFEKNDEFKVSGSLVVNGHQLQVNYTIVGNISKLLMVPPLARSLRRQHNLWQSTCFELFLKSKQGDHYKELNLSPYGAFQSYDFSKYRKGMAVDSSLNQAIVKAHEGNGAVRVFSTLSFTGQVDLQSFVFYPAVVLESQIGQQSFWALNHPKKAADFHNFSYSGLELEVSC